MTTTRHIVILTLVTLVASLLLSLHFFASPLRPWPDQGWMLQAAQRHAAGLGLTTVMDNRSLDITAPSWLRLTYFPPLYPLVVSALLRLGLDVEAAVKVVNAVAMIAGILGWVTLALRVIRGRAWLWLFALLLVVTGTATVPRGGTADYLYWAIMPWWTLALLAARSRLADRDRGNTLSRSLVVAALLVGVAIAIRWAAVVLVPAGVLVLIVPPRAKWPGVRRLACGALYAVPGVATYFGITAFNRWLGGAESLLTFVQEGWRFQHLATSYPLRSLVTVPLAVQPIAERVWRLADAELASTALSILIQVVLPLAVLALFGYLAATKRERLVEVVPSRDFVILAGATLVVWVGFLAFMAVRYNWDHVNWTYLEEPRYFRPIIPLAALLWLAILERCVASRLARGVAIGVMVVGSLYLVQAGARWQARWLTESDESWEAVEEIIDVQRRPGIHVVVDQDVSDYIIRGGPDLVATWYWDPEKLDRMTVGRPADLWVVWRTKERSAYFMDPEHDIRRFEAARKRFGIEKAWTSSGGAFEIWHAKLEPGE